MALAFGSARPAAALRGDSSFCALNPDVICIVHDAQSITWTTLFTRLLRDEIVLVSLETGVGELLASVAANVEVPPGQFRRARAFVQWLLAYGSI